MREPLIAGFADGAGSPMRGFDVWFRFVESIADRPCATTRPFGRLAARHEPDTLAVNSYFGDAASRRA
jgi:hypothetical protein